MALIPIIATLCIISAEVEKSSKLGFTLINSLFLDIGKISYSLYLWHWPIIVFYQLNIGTDVSKVDQAGIFILSILLDFLSWKFIDNTTRYTKPFEIPTLKVIFPSTIFTLNLSVLGIDAIIPVGIAHRYSDDLLKTAKYLDYPMHE